MTTCDQILRLGLFQYKPQFSGRKGNVYRYLYRAYGIDCQSYKYLFRAVSICIATCSPGFTPIGCQPFATLKDFFLCFFIGEPLSGTYNKVLIRETLCCLPQKPHMVFSCQKGYSASSSLIRSSLYPFISISCLFSITQ